MKPHRAAPRRHPFIACALGALVAAEGCASSPQPRHHQLRPTVQPTPRSEASHPDGLLVGVGPVRIPDYLDRPQIVTLSGERIDVREFERWAGSIERDIARVLVEDLSGLLPAERFFVTHWSVVRRSSQSEELSRAIAEGITSLPSPKTVR